MTGKIVTRCSAAGQKGSALILVVMLMSLLLFIPIGMQLTSTSFKETKQQLNMTAQADNMARAGLQGAEIWFRIQQNVSASNLVPAGHPLFENGKKYPFDDAAFSPYLPKHTINSSVGLVQEYDLQKGLKGRYEVRRSTVAGDVDPLHVHDISLKRGYTADKKGMAWSVESIGIIYQDKDPSSLYFNPDKDRVVARTRVMAELRRLEVKFPNAIGAALTTTKAKGVTLGNSCRILGGKSPGLVYYSDALDSKNTHDKAVIDNTSGNLAISQCDAANDYSHHTLFNIPGGERDLMLLADNVIQTTAGLGARTFSGFVFIDTTKMSGGTAVLSGNQVMSGSGLVFVNGNLTLNSGTKSVLNGILVVEGNLTMTGFASVNGAVLVKGTVTLSKDLEGVEFLFDKNMVDTVKNSLLFYRRDNASIHVYSGEHQ